MFKVLEQIDGNWVERDSPAVFCREATGDGGKRLRVALPCDEAFLLFKLVEGLRPPFQLLYVLHTPRGEGEAGRYQSPALSRTQTQDFLRRFEVYFLADARFDLWVRSASSDVIVWDRHNDLYVYGGLDDTAERLMQLGFQEGSPPSIGPHQHHYWREFDREAAEVLSSFNWHRTPLRPEDQQFVAPPLGIVWRRIDTHPERIRQASQLARADAVAPTGRGVHQGFCWTEFPASDQHS